MLLGKVATGPSGSDTSSNLDFAYGVGLSFGYRVLAGLSAGIAPQAIFHLSSKDSAGYSVIDSEKEYDLMARIAYAYAVAPKLDVYAEVLPGYSFVTYNEILQGSKAPKAHGVVLGGGLGAAFAITERLFANVGVGYQQGFQTSHGISNRDVKTTFLRIALGGGVKF
jgi:opacity protein-like surface antigen